MRPYLPLFALAASLLPFAAHAESGMCEYRHPAHPGWDFFASCSYTETLADGATTREVVVSNGSKFTTREGAGTPSVNGLAATKLDRDGAKCWRTEAENELICIYPADTIRPADPPPAPGGIDDFEAGAAVLDSTFGGGVSGFCLVSEAGALVEQGACNMRENCLELAEGGGASCLVTYDWKSGRVTETASTGDWTTLDGAVAIKGDPGCLVDTGAAITFCWSTRAMTPDTHPILAAPQAMPDNPAPAAAE